MWSGDGTDAQCLSASVLHCVSLMEINDFINNECERLNHTKMTVLGVSSLSRPVAFSSLCVSHLFTVNVYLDFPVSRIQKFNCNSFQSGSNLM